MATAIPVKGAFGTILFMMLFVLCFLFTYLFGNPNQPFFYFISILTCGLFVCVLVCIDNLRTFSAYAKKKKNFDAADVIFRTCPEYWTKKHVTDPKTKLLHTMCYNNMGQDMFVSGSLTDNNNSSYMNTTIDAMRNEAKFPQSNVEPSLSNILENSDVVCSNLQVIQSNCDTDVPASTSPVVEQFMNLDPDDPDYTKNLHTHTSVDLYVNSNITNHGDNVTPHSHVFLGTTSGTHSHRPGAGGSWEGADDSYAAEFDNFDNWINPHKTNGGLAGMEINLTKLNESENKCELANKFPWVEAYSKCA